MNMRSDKLCKSCTESEICAAISGRSRAPMELDIFLDLVKLKEVLYIDKKSQRIVYL
jgi:hypothetical protein